MPDNKPYRVQTAEGSCAMIILANEPKTGDKKCVYRAMDGQKACRIPTPRRMCKNPLKRLFLESLCVEGLVTNGGHSSKGPAYFAPGGVVLGIR
jgi:hypothetical protein